jgi:isopentenyl diphosphate isomerase/L-lactate dehydrogenase-like FMN-dependent dehydrogenase
MKKKTRKKKQAASTPKKKVYASIWYHPNKKWKLDEAIIVEDGKIVGSAVGGSFFFGGYRVKQQVLKEALLDMLFYDPDKYEDEEEWEKEFEKLKKEVEVEFVDDKTLEKLKKKYPEEIAEEGIEEDEEKLNYIG